MPPILPKWHAQTSTISNAWLIRHIGIDMFLPAVLTSSEPSNPSATSSKANTHRMTGDAKPQMQTPSERSRRPIPALPTRLKHFGKARDSIARCIRKSCIEIALGWMMLAPVVAVGQFDQGEFASSVAGTERAHFQQDARFRAQGSQEAAWVGPFFFLRSIESSRFVLRRDQTTPLGPGDTWQALTQGQPNLPATAWQAPQSWRNTHTLSPSRACSCW